MNDAWELHEAAMELLDKAALYYSSGDESHNLVIQAFELERDAAMELSNSIDLSSVRSILFHGAIILAIRLERFNDASDLIAIAQKGNVHKDFVDLIEKQRVKLDLILAV